MSHSHLLSSENAKTAMFAGKAFITIKNADTGNHYTYKIKRHKNKRGEPIDLWFVSLFTGNDNTKDYTFFGTIFADKSFKVSEKTRIGGSIGARGFMYVYSHLLRNTLTPNLQIWHEGRCCKCGRKLTNPLSIQTGIGPECGTHIHAQAKANPRQLRLDN